MFYLLEAEFEKDTALQTCTQLFLNFWQFEMVMSLVTCDRAASLCLRTQIVQRVKQVFKCSMWWTLATLSGPVKFARIHTISTSLQSIHRNIITRNLVAISKPSFSKGIMVTSVLATDISWISQWMCQQLKPVEFSNLQNLPALGLNMEVTCQVSLHRDNMSATIFESISRRNSLTI